MSALRVISRLGQLALLPLLSACVSGGTLQSVETNCASRFPTYADAWSCARNQRAGSYDEYRAVSDHWGHLAQPGQPGAGQRRCSTG